jgi:hypothetical protein
LAVFVLAAPAEEQKAKSPLEPLARFVGGAWVGKGKGPIPDFRTKVVYEWGLNRKLLKARSYLVSDKGERLVYESVFTWHPGKKKIVFLSVSAEGGIFDGVLEPKGDTYEFLFTSYFQDKATTFRQAIKFTDKDHTEWTVSAQKGKEWVKVIESRQRREKAAATPRK